MTTFDGKGANYSPFKEPVNREPKVSNYIIEKMYKDHRSRLMNAEPVVDCHIVIPEFMSNQDWKKSQENEQRRLIALENAQLYNRISKLQTEETRFAKDSKHHIKMIDEALEY